MNARRARSGAGQAATLVLAASVTAYAVDVTAGIPWLSHGPEPVDLLGVATKSVEALGLVFSIQLSPTIGGHRSPTRKEARR